jgi:hypothetical protein
MLKKNHKPPISICLEWWVESPAPLLVADSKISENNIFIAGN